MHASGLLGEMAESNRRGYGQEIESVVNSTWAVAALCLERWKGEDVSLVSDLVWSDDDELALGGRFIDISPEATLYALHQNIIPDDQLKFLAWKLGVNQSYDVPASEARLVIIRHFAGKPVSP